jgi:hypothetical protein
MVVLLWSSATAAQEYGSVPFHFANDTLGLDVRPLFRRGMAQWRSEKAAERFNKWAPTESAPATQEGVSEALFVALEQRSRGISHLQAWEG